MSVAAQRHAVAEGLEPKTEPTAKGTPALLENKACHTPGIRRPFMGKPSAWYRHAEHRRIALTATGLNPARMLGLARDACNRPGTWPAIFQSGSHPAEEREKSLLLARPICIQPRHEHDRQRLRLATSSNPRRRRSFRSPCHAHRLLARATRFSLRNRIGDTGVPRANDHHRVGHGFLNGRRQSLLRLRFQDR